MIAPVMPGNAPYSSPQTLLHGVECLQFKQHLRRMRKKALRETQTLRAGCSKAEPKIVTPPQTPFRGHKPPNLISWRWSPVMLTRTRHARTRTRTSYTVTYCKLQLNLQSPSGTLNTTGRETPQFLLTSGLEHGPWRHAAANK